MDISMYVPNLALVLLLYCLAEIAKRTFMSSEPRKQLIPFTCGLVGAIICVAAFVYNPEMTPTCNTLLDAIICGVVSGFAATGANQIYKQLTKGATTINKIDEDDDTTVKSTAKVTNSEAIAENKQ